MTFSLLELQVLIGLAMGKTLAQVGEEVHLGQPAISKVVRAAERKANLPLVEHRGRRLVLTTAGNEVAREAQLVLSQLHRLDSVVEYLRGGAGGPLRLLATNTPANYMLPAVVGAFQRQFPQAQVALAVGSDREIVQLFLQGDFDLAIAPQRDYPDSLLVEALYDEPITFFVGPSSALAKQSHVTWADVSRETIVGPFSEPYWADFFHNLARRGFRTDQRLELRAVEGVKRLVESGIGVGVLFRSAVSREFADGRLHPLSIENLHHAQPFCLVRRRHARPLAIAEEFRSFLTHWFRQLHAVEE